MPSLEKFLAARRLQRRTCAAVSCSFVETLAYPNFIIAETSRHSFSLSDTFQQLAEPLSTVLPDLVLKGPFAQ
jgi:hypothetical protein